MICLQQYLPATAPELAGPTDSVRTPPGAEQGRTAAAVESIPAIDGAEQKRTATAAGSENTAAQQTSPVQEKPAAETAPQQKSPAPEKPAVETAAQQASKSGRTAATAESIPAIHGAEQGRTAPAAGSENTAAQQASAAPAAEPPGLPSAQADPLPAFAPDPLIGPADSLRTGSPEAATTCRDTTQTAVFGPHSVAVVPARVPSPQGASLTENAVFQSFVLLLAAAYAMLLYRNLGDVRSLLGRFSRDTISGKRLTEDPGGSGFPRFLRVTTAIGMLFMGVAAVKYGDSLMPRALSEILSAGAVLALSLFATLACVLLVLFQKIVVRTAGAVTLSQPFVGQLSLLKRTYFSLAVIVASPPLLLFALCPRGSGDVWFYIVAAELLLTAILYLWESLRLFISKKISILHWFLYLCTVEIFPISLLWLLAAR